MRKRSFIQAMGAGLLAPLAPLARAQAWPSRPIRFVIPFPPGGSSDVFVRSLMPRMQELLGQPVIADYRAGASGTIGLDNVAKSEPDGYTIGLGSPGGLVAVPHMVKVPYDVERDFSFLTLLARVPSVLVTSNTSGIGNMRDLLDKARASGSRGLDLAHPGAGTLVHLAGELFKAESKLAFTFVPYKGGAAASQGVLGNQVPVGMVDLSVAWGQISGGLLKPLAVTGARRSPALPDVPTLAESGFPSAVMDADYGVLAPANLPSELLGRLTSALSAAIDAPAVRDTYLRLGAAAMKSTPQEYREMVLRDHAKWGAFIRQQKITMG
jgi:tripartite-type tricarboxylate transporter receptor subunit TctC